MKTSTFRVSPNLLGLILFLSLTTSIQAQQINADSLIMEQGIPAIDSLVSSDLFEEAHQVTDSLLSIHQEGNMNAYLIRRKAEININKRDRHAAGPWIDEAMKYWKEKQDTVNLEYTILIGFRGKYLAGEGLYEKAEPFMLDNLYKLEEMYGEEGLRIPVTLNSVGSFYSDWGKSEEAEKYFNRAVPLMGKVYGEDSYEYLNLLNNFAVMLSNIGSYNKSIPLFIQSLEVCEIVLGKEDLFYAIVLNNLARDHNYIAQFKEGAAYLTEAIALTAEHNGKDIPEYGTMLGNLAMSYGGMLEYEKALKIQLESIKISEELFGVDHINLGAAYNNIAYTYNKIGQHDLSEFYYLKVSSILENNLGKMHLYYRITTKNLSELYIDAKEFDKAEMLLYEYFQLNKLHIEHAFSYLSEEQKKYYIQNKIGNNDLFKSLSLLHPNMEFNKNQYDLALFEKGLRLSNSIATDKYIRESNDPIILEDYHLMLDTKKLIATELDKVAAKRINMDSLDVVLATIEKRLASASSIYRRDFINSNTDSEVLMESMSANELAVEFVHFKYANPIVSDSVVYVAAVLDPSQKKVHYIPLFGEDQLTLQNKLNAKRSDYINALYAYDDESIQVRGTKQESFYNLIWKPLEFLFKDKERIYFAPSGLLNRINLAAIETPKQVAMNHQYEMINMLNTRSIKEETPESIIKSAYVIGGIDYNGEGTLEEGTFATTEVKENIENLSVNSEEEVEENELVLDRSLLGEKWNFLPWSMQEVVNADQSLKKKGYEVQFLTGKEATEESFKSLGNSNVSPTIIHMATHGFFFPDPGEVNPNDSSIVYKVAQDPMLRAGLLLAGANEKWTEGNTKIDKEDGILTAYEISDMNLSKTQLVILSACETGLGDIKRAEGVFGLQRAFKKAGVKYIMMSLWQIPDKQSSLFMDQFYQNWLGENMDLRMAFNKTQNDMRSQTQDPYYWAGFVLIE